MGHRARRIIVALALLLTVLALGGDAVAQAALKTRRKL